MKNQKWLEEDNRLLLLLRKKGLSYLEISEIMNRSTDSLRCQFFVLESKLRLDYEQEAKILILDIETSLLEAYLWRLGEQYVGPDSLITDWFLMSFSAKWRGREEVMSDVLTSKEAKNKDDKRICKSIWKLLNEADIIIGHNSDKFDLKKLNTRFIQNGLSRPSVSKTIDTLKICKSMFACSSNKLNFWCKFLGLDVKEDSGGYQTWIDCLSGKKEALATLVEYNRFDVVITEQLYDKLKDWQKTTPRKPQYGWK